MADAFLTELDKHNLREVDRDVQLKHLGFVRILAVYAVVLVSSLYDCAKQNSGSFKSAVEKVEDAVTSAVGPVYEKFKCVPTDLLIFVDDKVEVAKNKFTECAPPAAKRAVIKAQSFVINGTKIVQELAEEAKTEGPMAAISHAGKISKKFTASQIAFVWFKVNHYPALNVVSEMAIPTAAHWSEKYNKLVTDMASKGYTLFCYVLLVPVEELKKAYKQVEAAAGKKKHGGSCSSSGSDSD